MAAATYSTTTSSDLSTLYRQVQMGMYQAAQFGVDEWDALMAGRAAKDFKIDWSTRQVTVQLDLNDDIGTAAIPEGGYEARPSSQTLVDGSLSFILLNSRFTFSRTSEYIARRSPRAVIEDQLKYQAKKKLQGLRRKVGDMFYGFSTGTIAKVSSDSTDDIVLKDLYGISGLGGLTTGPGGGVENRQVTDLFRVGDYIAALNPSGPALRTSGIVAIDSITPSTNTITGSAVSDISSLTANDLIVFANNLENTTMAGGTERSLNLTGLLDIVTSTSLHSVSGTDYPAWNAGSADTSGGRFTGVKLRKMKQGISNVGGGKLDTVWIAQGVDNDLFAQAQAGLRYSDAFKMEIDGDATAKGVKKMASRLCPDGFVFAYDSSAIKKGMLLPAPGDNWATGDNLDKLQDISGSAASLDFPFFMFCTNRGNTAYASGCSQQ